MVNTPYDDVFRTLLTDCTALIIPVVNELFHTSYTGKETIHLLQNELFIKLPDGSEQERITDSSFEILGRERKRYHVECQSTEDGSMNVGKKYRGTLDKVLVKYVKDKLAAYPDIDPSLIFITHSGIDPEYIKLVKNTIEEAMHFDEIHITKASCTISSHCGPNTLGILFETY